jgi:hypothetical protein
VVGPSMRKAVRRDSMGCSREGESGGVELHVGMMGQMLIQPRGNNQGESSICSFPRPWIRIGSIT